MKKVQYRLIWHYDTSPQLWMRLQESYNLWYATHHSDEWQQVQKISALLATPNQVGRVSEAYSEKNAIHSMQ